MAPGNICIIPLSAVAFAVIVAYCLQMQPVSCGWQNDPYGFSMIVKQAKSPTAHRTIIRGKNTKQNSDLSAPKMLQILNMLGRGPSAHSPFQMDPDILFTEKKRNVRALW